jgi:hypothetical protein
MKITRPIRFFIGFAIVAILDIGTVRIFGSHRITGDQLSEMRIAVFMGLVLFTSALGMICSLVVWLVANAVARWKAKACTQEDVSHGKSSVS